MQRFSYYKIHGNLFQYFRKKIIIEYLVLFLCTVYTIKSFDLLNKKNNPSMLFIKNGNIYLFVHNTRKWPFSPSQIFSSRKSQRKRVWVEIQMSLSFPSTINTYYNSAEVLIRKRWFYMTFNKLCIISKLQSLFLKQK